MNSLAGAIIATAMTLLGLLYGWGSKNPANGKLDCSGLTYWVYLQHGVELPQWARGQWVVAKQTQEPEIGDLVFFVGTYPMPGVQHPRISHVGIYIGDNKMINANSSRGVAIDDLSDPYWQEHFHSYGRVLPDEIGG